MRKRSVGSKVIPPVFVLTIFFVHHMMNYNVDIGSLLTNIKPQKTVYIYNKAKKTSVRHR